MSKYFVPVVIEGKWWVVEHIPLPDARDYYFEDLSSFDADGYNEHCNLYNNPPKHPTLESDSAYWASKAGVKMGEGEFILKEIETDQQIGEMLTAGGDKEPAYHWELTALPKKSPTTKELIEQEAERRYQFKTSGYLPERSFFNNEQSNKISGFIDGGTFALSLPKQENGDAWDEVQGKFNAWLFENGEDTLDNFFSDLKQHYSISKIK